MADKQNRTERFPLSCSRQRSAPIGCRRPDVLLSPPNVRLLLKASGPWTPEGLLLTVNPPSPPPTSPPAHYCTPSTVIDWPLPSPSRSLPDRSLTLSETPLLSGEVIWVRALLVFMLPRRWGKKKQNFVEVKVADHRKRFHLSVPRGPGRISAARLSCSELPLPGKSELSKFEMKELLLGRRRDLRRGSPGCHVMTRARRVNL